MRKAFTLIELLIVVSIIGVLAVALLPSITDGPSRAKDVARITAVKEGVAAIEKYAADTGRFPNVDPVFDAECIDASDPQISEYYNKPGVPTFAKFEDILSLYSDYEGLYCSDGSDGIYPTLIRLADGYAVVIPVENIKKANTLFVQAVGQKYFNDDNPSAIMTRSQFQSFINAGGSTTGPNADANSIYGYVMIR